MQLYYADKGVKQAEMATIDQAMKDYAKKVDEIYNYDYQIKPGAGAAGGLGYALCAFCQAKLLPGFEVVSEIVELERDKAFWQEREEDEPVEDVNGKFVGISKEQIEAYNDMIERRKEQMDWVLYVNRRFL